MSTVIVHGPWLTKQSGNDPAWVEKSGLMWVYDRPPSSVKSYFDIPKEATEIRFCLAQHDEQGLSYQILESKKSTTLHLSRGGKKLQWHNVLIPLRDFIAKHHYLYLTVEYR